MASSVDIYNQALIILGASPIVTFDDDDLTEAVVGRIMYPSIKGQFLRSYPWRAATRFDTLAKFVDKPIDPDWDWRFSWPNDAIRILRIMGAQYPDDPNPHFKSVGREIWTKTDGVAAEYIADLDEPEMDESMVSALAAQIARDIAYTLTASNSRESNLNALFDVKLNEARTADRQEASHETFRISTLTDVR